MTGLLLLDRDGTLLRHQDPYILDWRDVAYAPGAWDALAAAARAGFRVAVCSNQSPVNRRLIPRRFVDQVNASIRTRAARHGVDLVGFFMCPHTPDESCACRKPAAGQFTAAARAAGANPRTAWVVGDAATDMEAGRRAGAARLLHVCDGRDRTPCRQSDVRCLGGIRNLARLFA